MTSLPRAISNPLKKIRTAQSDLAKKVTAKMLEKPSTVKFGMNIWMPLAGSGIRFIEWADDNSSARVQLNLRWWNQNMHGAAFGGTLFAMTDVAFGTVAARFFGKEYEAWTRTGTFQYISPGRDGAYLDVEVTPEMAKWVKKTIAEDGYANVPFTSIIKNKDGSIVGIGQQDLHVRPRGGGKRAKQPQQALQPRGLVLEHLTTTLIWQCFRQQPEILTALMSEQRRIPSPEDQIRHVIKTVLEKSSKTREDLLALEVPEEYIIAAEK